MELRRRPRYIAEPTGRTVRITDRDLYLFSRLNVHGPLPTSFLIEYSKHLDGHEWRGTKRRLMRLFHEHPYLARPPHQFRTIDARYQEIVHANAEAADDALKAEGRHEPVTRSGPWLHQHMTACITASIELGALRSGHRYISQQEALGERPLSVDISYTPPDGRAEKARLMPDAFFGIDYGGKRRYYALEADRGTEPVSFVSPERKTILRSVLQYRQLIGRHLYKEHYGLTDGLVLLFVTTSEARLKNIRDYILSLAPQGNNYILLRHVSNFGAIYNPPVPMLDLYDKPWERAGHEPFLIGQ